MSGGSGGGYGRPPEHARFKQGQSGNPTGRPKGTRNLASIVRGVLAERIPIVENGRRKRISKLEAALKQAANKAASGDARVLRMLVDLVRGFDAADAPHTMETAKTAAELRAADDLVIRAMAEMLETLSDGEPSDG